MTTPRDRRPPVASRIVELQMTPVTTSPRSSGTPAGAATNPLGALEGTPRPTVTTTTPSSSTGLFSGPNSPLRFTPTSPHHGRGGTPRSKTDVSVLEEPEDSDEEDTFLGLEHGDAGSPANAAGGAAAGGVAEGQEGGSGEGAGAGGWRQANLFVFAKGGCIQRWCGRLVSSTQPLVSFRCPRRNNLKADGTKRKPRKPFYNLFFDHIIMLLILVSSVMLAMESPSLRQDVGVMEVCCHAR